MVCEYHAISWRAAAFMPRDVAADPAYASVLQACHRRLLEFCDPIEVDQRAKRRQADLLAKFGGREVALARGRSRLHTGAGD